MDPNCLFCKISAKQIPAKFVYEDDDVFAFEDINPQAPTHILICPRKHFAALQDAEPADRPCSASYKCLPPTWPESSVCYPVTALSSTTAAAPASLYSICTCISSAAAISVGPPASI